MPKFVKEGTVWVSLEGPKVKFGQLKELIAYLDYIGVPDSYILEDCTVTFTHTGRIEPTLDGESLPGNDKYDIIIITDFKKEDV